MVLTAEQQWMVAMVYEKAAADTMGVPVPQRAAFARKAKRFRTLARIAAKIEATAVIKQARPLKPLQTDARGRRDHETGAAWFCKRQDRLSQIHGCRARRAKAVTCPQGTPSGHFRSVSFDRKLS
jgi:hypothetical protein